MRRGVLRDWFYVLTLAFLATPLWADELYLKNGTVLEGTVNKIAGISTSGIRTSSPGDPAAYPYWMVDDGVRRFIAYRRIVSRHVESSKPGMNIFFKMKHERISRSAGFSNIGGFSKIQSFDLFGRRTVQLPTQRGMVDVIQGINLLRPDYSVIEGLTHDWEYGVDTSTLPVEVIQSLIDKTSNRDDPAERKAAVIFYLQAQMYQQCQEELRRLAEYFPDMAEWCQDYQRQVGELIALKAINEIERRQDAGQHLLAMQYARRFPEDLVSAAVRQRALDVLEQYEQALMDRDRILLLLDMLQAEIPEPKFTRLAALRASIVDELRYESMSRLEPFLRTESDDSLNASEKLALAYSGWLLGNAGAITNLDEAIRLWDARFLVLEYLRLDQDPVREQEIVQELEGIEGMSVERLAQMIGQLPLPFEPPAVEPGVPAVIDIPTEKGAVARKYTVVLPPEYHATHKYPVIVALRGETTSFESELKWWAGDSVNPGWAQRRGFIVIAPHYCAEDATSYDPTNPQLETILHAITHARKRFHIDSDRIFLSGHGMGGDACFDVGLSYPGIFAGVIPIGGTCPPYCRLMKENAPHQSWYIVAGQKDRNVLEKNAGILNGMMVDGQDVIYCEYKNRGFESYHEEQERLLTWMQLVRRPPMKDVADWSVSCLGRSKPRHYWLLARQIPERVEDLVKPVNFEGRIREGGENIGTIRITHPGRATTIWLAPEIFDFKKRYRIHINGKLVATDFFKPSMEAMLSDLRDRGDRQQLYWSRLEF